MSAELAPAHLSPRLSLCRAIGAREQQHGPIRSIDGSSKREECGRKAKMAERLKWVLVTAARAGMKRWRHLLTIWRGVSSRAAMRSLPNPSAASKTIFARVTYICGSRFQGSPRATLPIFPLIFASENAAKSASLSHVGASGTLSMSRLGAGIPSAGEIQTDFRSNRTAHRQRWSGHRGAARDRVRVGDARLGNGTAPAVRGQRRW